MDVLPNEILIYIFSFLRRRDLLNSRLVCSKWNPILLSALDWSNIKIGFKTNKETEDFCELMKRSAGGLKFQTILFNLSSYTEGIIGMNVLSSYSRILLNSYNDPINVSNYKQLSNEIAPSAVAYYFFLDCDCPSQFDVRCSEVINIMLNATLPNLRILHLKSKSVFPEPGFHPLNNLDELGLENREWTILDGTLMDFDVVRKWITKAPNMKKFRSNIDYSRLINSSKLTEYFQLLQKIPEVAIDVYLIDNHENQLPELSLITITELHLRVLVDHDDDGKISHALNLFFEKQGQKLQILQIKKLYDMKSLTLQEISPLKNLTLPYLPKLKTFEAFEGIFNGGFLPFDPNMFKILQNVNLNREFSLQNPFSGGEYSTVTKLIVDTYLVQDWRSMFPRIKKFKTSIKDLNLLRQILRDPPTIHHLVVKIPADTELIHCLIVNPSSVAKLELEIDLCSESQHRLLKPNLEKERKDAMDLWNILTGYAKIENDSVFLIKEVNDTTEITMETSIHRSIADIKNLWKLRGRASNVLIKAAAYLCQQQGSFVNLKKLVLHDCSFRRSYSYSGGLGEYANLYHHFKMLRMWNFDVEIREDASYNFSSSRTFRFSKKKIPKYMLSYSFNY